MQNVRIKNAKLNLLYQKLEMLHSGYLEYAAKYERLYKFIVNLDQREKYKKTVKWIRRNKNHQSYIQNFSKNYIKSNKTVHKIPANFMEFFNLNADLQIGEFDQKRT